MNKKQNSFDQTKKAQQSKKINLSNIHECLGEKCPNNCCSNKFKGLSDSLINFDNSKFLQIQLDTEEVKRLRNNKKENLIENINGEYYLKLNDDYSCTAFENGKCTIYDIRPDVCKLYPYYFDPFCGIGLDKNCPGNFHLDTMENDLYNLIDNRVHLFNNSQHFFFDGYDIDNQILGNIEYIDTFLTEVKNKLIDGNCKVVLIPYFNGKIKEDGGISCVIIGSNFHFTCHTFCYKNTVFIDCYGKNNYEKELLPIIIKYFKCYNFDLCKNNSNKKGNFGKHVIISDRKPLNHTEAINLIKNILKEVEMNPIHELIIDYRDDNNYDILQPIAESHISVHSTQKRMIIDVFSCKAFDENKIIKLLNGDETKEIRQINRGINYK